jgi:hypothetical protein
MADTGGDGAPEGIADQIHRLARRLDRVNGLLVSDIQVR